MNKKVLECSSKGDKRFSAFYARVTLLGVTKSIEEWYQGAKVINGRSGLHWREAKGKRVEAIEVFGKRFEAKYLSDWYKYLWMKYFVKNKDLLSYARTFDEFNDIFKGKSINCQADVIRDLARNGLKAELEEIQEFVNMLKKIKKIGGM